MIVFHSSWEPDSSYKRTAVPHGEGQESERGISGNLRAVNEHLSNADVSLYGLLDIIKCILCTGCAAVQFLNSGRSSHPRRKLIKRDISYEITKMDPLDVFPWRNIMVMHSCTLE